MNSIIFGVPLSAILLALLASFIGFAAHVLLKVAEIRDEDSSFTLTRYFAINPYRTISKLIVVLFSAVALAEPEITVMAFAGFAGIGYAADSAANKFGK